MPAPGRGAEFAITCGPDAQKVFDQGFFFLHNMDYAKARRAFETAATNHASCAMLHWGVAMTYFQPLWPGQPTAESLKNGTAAVERAKASSAKASARERDYVAAVAAFYDGGDKVDHQTRSKSWAAAQKVLAERYPDDVEAQAFSGLARLATMDKSDKTYAASRGVAEEMEKLLVKKPDHPGLMHYLLHAYDNPAYANQAVEVARKYEAVTPDGAHALHMPSHIHVRLGNWKEVVDWNIKSAAAALKNPAGDRISRDFLHALDYMTYGYLQMGDDEQAKQMVGKIDPATKYELSSGPAAYGLAATPARYAIERRAWAEAAALVPRKVDYNWDQYPWAEAVIHAARGLGAARTKDLKSAEKSLVELDRLKPLVDAPWWQKRVQIERDVVAAWIAHGRRDYKKAEELFRRAGQLETAAGKDSVEPGHVISANEELGDFLLDRKRPADALQVFKTVLDESPRRFHSVSSAARAAELAGRHPEAKAYYAQLLEISTATTTRPARAQALAYLAKHP